MAEPPPSRNNWPVRLSPDPDPVHVRLATKSPHFLAQLYRNVQYSPDGTDVYGSNGGLFERYGVQLKAV